MDVSSENYDDGFMSFIYLLFYHSSLVLEGHKIKSLTTPMFISHHALPCYVVHHCGHGCGHGFISVSQQGNVL